MIRFVLIYFVVIIFIGAYWTFADPWAFANIPGDIFVVFEGLRVYLPFSTSWILTVIISVVVMMFEAAR